MKSGRSDAAALFSSAPTISVINLPWIGASSILTFRMSAGHECCAFQLENNFLGRRTLLLPLNAWNYRITVAIFNDSRATSLDPYMAWVQPSSNICQSKITIMFAREDSNIAFGVCSWLPEDCLREIRSRRANFLVQKGLLLTVCIRIDLVNVNSCEGY